MRSISRTKLRCCPLRAECHPIRQGPLPAKNDSRNTCTDDITQAGNSSSGVGDDGCGRATGRTAPSARIGGDRSRSRRKISMSTKSDEQDLAAFGLAVRQLREQRGMSPDDRSEVSRRSDGRKMSAWRIGRIEVGEAIQPMTRC